MSGRAKAKEYVLALAKTHGCIDSGLVDKLTKSLPRKARKELFQAMERMQDNAGKAVLRLAEHLYPKHGADFVFALLQNCDDNNYSNSERVPPSATFSVYPDRIHVSCNEVGFTKEDVRAICNMGCSTRIGENSLGKKGVGFKSVFKAAERVHIQSGDYSFYFDHHDDKTVLGMITPIWTEHIEELDAQRSHIMLNLRHGTFDMAAVLWARIRDQFCEQNLLSLRKLQKIDISFYGAQDVLTSTTEISLERQTTLTTLKTKTTTIHADRTETSEVVKHCLMHKHMLEFPVDKVPVHVGHSESICAVFPVKKIGSKYQIQADCITSERKQKTTEGIADTCLGDLFFFHDHDRILDVDILSPPHGRIEQDSLQCYAFGSLSVEKWLRMVKTDLASPNSFIKSFNSQRSSAATSKDKTSGSSCVAEFLYAALTSSSESSKVKEAIRRLELIPLRDGRWISATTPHPVYYPQVETTGLSLSLEIPVQLELDVVEAQAASKSAWRRLYDSLGIETASVDTVRNAIFQKYQDRTVTLEPPPWMVQLQFLYQTEHLVQAPYGYHRLRLPTRNDPSSLHDGDIYIVAGDPYGVELLLPSTGDGAPVPDYACITRDESFDSEPGRPTPQTHWGDWLEECFHVRRHLRLLNANGTGLSHICNYIAKHHPVKFLGYLQNAWEHDKPTNENRKYVMDELRCVNVLCQEDRRISLGEMYLPLRSLKSQCNNLIISEFFPWLVLETDCSQHDDFPPEWMFLGTALWKDYRTPVTFLLDVLKHVVRGNKNADHMERPERVFELYARLQKVVDSSSTNEAEKIRRAFQSENLIYLHGTGGDSAKWGSTGDCVWEIPVGLVDLCAKRALSPFFEDETRRELYASLEGFFTKTLKVPDCTLQDIVDDIVFLKNDATAGLDSLNVRYRCLLEWQNKVHKEAPEAAEENRRFLRKQFATEKLIRCSRVGGTELSWYAPDQCLWTTSTASIPGFFPLADLYPDLCDDICDFFVGELGVLTISAKLKSVYDSLMDPPVLVPEAKESLKMFSALLAKSSKADTADMKQTRLLEAPVLPIRMPDGDVQLCSGMVSFSFVDRESLAREFSGRARLLDFDLEETRALQPFLQWAGLQDRGLSKMIEEVTYIASDDRPALVPPKRSIRHKARALFSVALAYSSPRAEASCSTSLYALLRGTQTYMTDKITSELHLDQGGDVVEINRGAATVHIADNTTSLVVHVPRDKARQALCFNAVLPERLSAWLMTDPTTRTSHPVPTDMVRVVQSVLCAEQIAMEAILDLYGIPIAKVPDEETDDSSTDNGDATPSDSSIDNGDALPSDDSTDNGDEGTSSISRV